MAAALSPTAALGFLLANPERNLDLNVPVEHFVIATNVSFVALTVGLLVARSALQLRQYPSLLVACGFMCMAGIFTVHGLATPGVLKLGDDAGLVVGVSAQLSLWVAAVFFAVRYTPLAAVLARRVAARVLLGTVTAALAVYAALGLAWPSAFGGLARLVLVGGGAGYSYDYAGPSALPFVDDGAGYVPYFVVSATVCLFAFSAYRQGREFFASRQPMHGALALSFAFLGQAQVSQVSSPIWTLAWWEYHGLMLTAVVLALGAIFVELDRRRGLERFLPSSVVSRVIAGDALALGGERTTVTILFADLRGATALADRETPEVTVEVLNAYLRVMATAVIEAGGILDKFLGDGLMAIFGAQGEERDGAPAAAGAALAIRARLAELTRKRKERGQPTFDYGVGLHTGEAILGVVGLAERSDFTAIGDAVNTASRMEALTKELSVDVVLSAEVVARLAGSRLAIRSLGESHVRGKALPVSVSTLG